MKAKNISLCMFFATLLILFTSITAFAASTDNFPNDNQKNAEITPYSYRENLLVSYKEYWFKDGAGNDIYVVYNRQYRQCTFLNGYEIISREVSQLPLTGMPSGTYRHQQVKVNYRFY